MQFIKDHFSTQTVFWLLLLYLACAVVFVFNGSNGPKGDEGIYIEAGIRLLDGANVSAYSSWHNGSPLVWAPVAGKLYEVAGLNGLRIFAVFLAMASLALAFFTARSLSSELEARLGLFFVLLYAPFLFFAHIAVYDVPALFFCMSAVWLTTEKGGFPLVLAGILLGLAIITKYAFVLFAPVVLLQTWLIPARGFRSALFMGLITGILVAVHNVIVLGGIVPPSYGSYEATINGTTALHSFGMALFLLAPVAVLFLIRRDKSQKMRRYVVIPGVLSLIFWPAFHTITGNPISQEKHVVYAVLFALPLTGHILARFSNESRRRLMIAGCAFFPAQLIPLELSWTDSRPVISYLEQHVSESDSVLTNCGTYRFKYHFMRKLTDYEAQIGQIDRNAAPEQLLQARFLIWQEADHPALVPFKDVIYRCYEPVFSVDELLVGMDDYIPWGIHTKVTTTVYRRRNVALSEIRIQQDSVFPITALLE